MYQRRRGNEPFWHATHWASILALPVLFCPLACTVDSDTANNAAAIQDASLFTLQNSANGDSPSQYLAYIYLVDHTPSPSDFCSGVFVAHNALLTAGSCVRKLHRDPSRADFKAVVFDDGNRDGRHQEIHIDGQDIYFHDCESRFTGCHSLVNNVSAPNRFGKTPLDLALMKFDTETAYGSFDDYEVVKRSQGFPRRLRFPRSTATVGAYTLKKVGDFPRRRMSIQLQEHIAIGMFGYKNEEFHTLSVGDSEKLCADDETLDRKPRFDHGTGAFMSPDGYTIELIGIYSRNLDWYRGAQSCATKEGNLFVDVSQESVREWIEDKIRG